MNACWTLLVLTVAAAASTAAASDVKECFGAAAPIACFQTMAYRRVRELIAQETIVLSQGVELVKRPSANQGRKAEDVAADAVLSQPQGDEEQRQEALQQFVADKVQEAVSERSLNLKMDKVAANIAQTVRSLSVSEQGRAIKKIIKSLLPVIVGFVLKVATLVVISYIGIGLLAKKAAIGSLLAVIISVVTFVRSLIVSKHHKAHEQAQLLGALAGQVSAYHNIAATQDIANSIATQQAAAALQAQAHHNHHPFSGWKN